MLNQLDQKLNQIINFYRAIQKFRIEAKKHRVNNLCPTNKPQILEKSFIIYLMSRLGPKAKKEELKPPIKLKDKLYGGRIHTQTLKKQGKLKKLNNSTEYT